MGKKTSILMSRNNPEGHKLEELITSIVDDINIKNNQIRDSDNDMANDIISNNMTCIYHLLLAKEAWNNSRELLNLIGPDKGPTEPRI